MGVYTSVSTAIAFFPFENIAQGCRKTGEDLTVSPWPDRIPHFLFLYLHT